MREARLSEQHRKEITRKVEKKNIEITRDKKAKKGTRHRNK